MTYFNDNAKKSPLEDELEQKHFAYYLAKGLADLENINDSYVLGICGKWGDGKTSVINMALRYYKYLIKDPNKSIDDLNTEIEEEDLIKKNGAICSNKIPYSDKWIKRNLLFARIILVLIASFILFTAFSLLELNVQGVPFPYKELIIFTFLVSLLYFIFEKFSIPSLNLLFSVVDVKSPFAIFKKSIYDLFKKEDFIKIYFEPWNYTSKEKILEEFFRQLTMGIDNQGDTSCWKNLAKQISAYAKLISNVDVSFIEDFFQDKNVVSLKENISSKLHCCDEKVIIIIDDIDRLLPDEILLIFQTVKLIANFPNIIYILAFDKDKVCRDIEHKYGINGEEYIKKIVQIEKNLPIISQDILECKFIKFINEVTSENVHKDENNIRKLYKIALEGKYINNIRDLNRFFNSFKFTYSAFKNEKINIFDLVAITAIETFESSLYYFIRKHKFALCSLSAGVYEKNESCIYITNQPNLNLNNFAKEVNKFKNINIIAIIFPGLFWKIKKEVKAYIDKQNEQKGIKKENLPEDIIIMANHIDERIEEFKQIESFNVNSSINYRRLSNHLFFDNYFRNNFDATTITNEENELLKNTLNNVNAFKAELIKLYGINPAKILDYKRYWESTYNQRDITKENVLMYLKNFLSLGQDEIDLINFLEENDVFYNFVISIITEYNNEHPEDMITFNDIYNLIKDSITYLNNNLYFFVYLIVYHFNFPENDPPKLTKKDEKDLRNIRSLIQKNINYTGIFNLKKALSTLNYLYKYLGFENWVNTFIDKILTKGQEVNLLKLLLTAKNFQTINGRNYDSISVFFDQINKQNELKIKLLDMYYDTEFTGILEDEKFFVYSNNEEEYLHIVYVALCRLFKRVLSNITVKDEFKKIETYEEKETALKILNEEFKDYSVKGFRFMKEMDSYEQQAKGAIEHILKEIKAKDTELYDKYNEKFDLFLES